MNKRWTIRLAHDENSNDGDHQDEILALSVLASLADAQSPDSADIVVELIDLYLVDASFRLAALKTAIDSADTSGWKQAAHALRGSSSTLGARRVASYAGQLEQTDCKDIAQSTFNILAHEFSNVRAAMLSERQRRTQLAGANKS
ncbi:MAG TPA: Hpt domain-containing protein [Pyrinomonadaceae bacterium]|nr:Hpt domain-containing protein [Pyrinomonadaceae bacterium]